MLGVPAWRVLDHRQYGQSAGRRRAYDPVERREPRRDSADVDELIALAGRDLGEASVRLRSRPIDRDSQRLDATGDSQVELAAQVDAVAGHRAVEHHADNPAREYALRRRD